VRWPRTGRYGFGRTDVTGVVDIYLLAGQPERQTVWMSHSDVVVAPPPEFRVIGSTDSTPVGAFEDPEHGFLGIQYHPRSPTSSAAWRC
jgi:GMP synthase (glutamine-hydrolysing)